MRIEILRSTVCDGRVVEAGEIIDTNDNDALTLLRMSKAKPAGEKPAETAAMETTEKAVRKPPAKKQVKKE